MNFKKIRQSVLALTLIGSIGTMGLGVTTLQTNAHGYINNSRAALAKSGENKNAGPVQYEPQSVEAPGNYPQAGPADGQIASGGGKFSALDAQTADRWTKVPMKGGKNTFTWTLTAPHRTSEWKYYITKKGWDPNDPLERSDFEQIGRVEGNGQVPLSTVTHTIDVPTDRQGYYVILGVWEIADTENAFYQVVDVQLSNDGTDNGNQDKEAPTVPTGLKSTSVKTTSATLSWNPAKDNTGVDHYNLYRDGEKVKTVQGTSVTDTNLTADKSYSYTVQAVDGAGNESALSKNIEVRTEKLPAVDTEAPTAPKNVHSMGETANSIDLMWMAATDNVAVDHYKVFRNGTLIKSLSETRLMDSGLQADTQYTYTIVAVDAAGNESVKSSSFSVKTKADTTQPVKPVEPVNPVKPVEPTKPEPVEPVKPVNPGESTWNSNQVYVGGDTVVYNGVEYTAKWWTRGETPSKSEVWKAASGALTEWNSDKAYMGGERVTYKGVTYEAKWWSRGDMPTSSMVWKKVK